MKRILEATKVLSHDALKLYLYIVFATQMDDAFDVEELGIEDLQAAFAEIQKYDYMLKNTTGEDN